MAPNSGVEEVYNEKVVDRLFDLVMTLSTIEFSERQKSGAFKQWMSEISNTSTTNLIGLISSLDTLKESKTSRAVKALREAAISQVSYRNATLISNTMQQLDKTASRLTIVSIFLAVLGILIAILQIAL